MTKNKQNLHLNKKIYIVLIKNCNLLFQGLHKGGQATREKQGNLHNTVQYGTRNLFSVYDSPDKADILCKEDMIFLRTFKHSHNSLN